MEDYFRKMELLILKQENQVKKRTKLQEEQNQLSSVLSELL